MQCHQLRDDVQKYLPARVLFIGRVYHVRADNNNTIHLLIDGGTNLRYCPVFKVDNYWAASKPSAGCVVLNGTALVENVDYYAKLDAKCNNLEIALNKVIISNDAQLYIDDNNPDGYQRVGPTRKLSYGLDHVGSAAHVWVKYFTGSTFGADTSKQWYINWNMTTPGSSQPSRDDEIWYMASSVEKAGQTIDTTSGNLIPGCDAASCTMGNISFNIGGTFPKTSEHV